MNIYQVITLCFIFFCFGGFVQYLLSSITLKSFMKQLSESNKVFEKAIIEFRELVKQKNNEKV